MPGSVLRVAVDNTAPIAHGSHEPVDVFFDNSPVFKLESRRDAEGRPAGGVVRHRDAAAQRLGLGPGLPGGGRAVVDATVGEGKLFLFGPEITFRAQPHGTFKFLFNGIHLGGRKVASATKTTAVK